MNYIKTPSCHREAKCSIGAGLLPGPATIYIINTVLIVVTIENGAGTGPRCPCVALHLTRVNQCLCCVVTGHYVVNGADRSGGSLHTGSFLEMKR